MGQCDVESNQNSWIHVVEYSWQRYHGILKLKYRLKFDEELDL